MSLLCLQEKIVILPYFWFLSFIEIRYNRSLEPRNIDYVKPGTITCDNPLSLHRAKTISTSTFLKGQTKEYKHTFMPGYRPVRIAISIL